MSLYNQLFGYNPGAAILTTMLRLHSKENPVPRFRDCYLYKKDDDLVIVLYTRLGGGNREHYQEAIDELRKHREYIRDYDDDYDSTYALFEFSIPWELIDMMAEVKEQIPIETDTPGERWKKLMAKLESGEADDPQVKRAREVGDKIFGKIFGDEPDAEVGGIKIIKI